MTLLPYELSFINPLQIVGSDQKKYKVESKQGFIIKIEKDNITSIADVSPLPYLNIETFEDSIEQCKKLNINQIFLDLDMFLKTNKESFLIEKFLDYDFSKYTSYPSLQHGLSCAFSDHYRKKMKIEILGSVQFHGLIPNQLTNSSEIVSIKKAIILEKSGFKKAKIKIGPSEVTTETLKNENGLLKKILSETKSLKLRLDANRKLKLEDYAILLDGLNLDRIDYVEEPLSKSSDLVQFNAATKLNIAIDENIHLMKDVVIDKISAVVLKPTLLGDYHNIKRIISHYSKRGASPVISSCFESQVGIYQLAQLAYALNPNESHGLDTFDCYLEKLMDLNINKNAINLHKDIELKGPVFI